MSQSRWLRCVRDCGLVGFDKWQLEPAQASLLFTVVNHRREACVRQVNDALAGEHGDGGKKPRLAPMATTMDGTAFGAGSVNYFTFSEFIEALLLAALQISGPGRGGAGQADPDALLCTRHVLAAVSHLLEDFVLPHAKREDVRPALRPPPIPNPGGLPPGDDPLLSPEKKTGGQPCPGRSQTEGNPP